MFISRRFWHSMQVMMMFVIMSSSLLPTYAQTLTETNALGISGGQCLTEVKGSLDTLQDDYKGRVERMQRLPEVPTLEVMMRLKQSLNNVEAEMRQTCTHYLGNGDRNPALWGQIQSRVNLPEKFASCTSFTALDAGTIYPECLAHISSIMEGNETVVKGVVTRDALNKRTIYYAKTLERLNAAIRQIHSGFLQMLKHLGTINETLDKLNQENAV